MRSHTRPAAQGSGVTSLSRKAGAVPTEPLYTVPSQSTPMSPSMFQPVPQPYQAMYAWPVDSQAGVSSDRLTIPYIQPHPQGLHSALPANRSPVLPGPFQTSSSPLTVPSNTPSPAFSSSAPPDLPHRSRSSTMSEVAAISEGEVARLQSRKTEARKNEAKSRGILRDAEKRLRQAIFTRSRQMPNSKHRVFEAAADLLLADLNDFQVMEDRIRELEVENRQLLGKVEQLRKESFELSSQLSAIEANRSHMHGAYQQAGVYSQPLWASQQAHPEAQPAAYGMSELNAFLAWGG